MLPLFFSFFSSPSVLFFCPSVLFCVLVMSVSFCSVLLFCVFVVSVSFCSVSLSCVCPSVLSFCTVLMFCVLVVSVSFCSVLLYRPSVLCPCRVYVLLFCPSSFLLLRYSFRGRSSSSSPFAHLNIRRTNLCLQLLLINYHVSGKLIKLELAME